MNPKKIVIFTLLVVLSLANVLCLCPVGQAQSSTWMVISLPYTINASGNYRIGGDWTSSTANQQGLIINASHVKVDGQNYSVTVTNSSGGKPSAVYINSQTDVVLQDINVTSSYYGFRVENSTNITLQDCTVSKTYSQGIQFNSSSGFGIINCTLQDVFGGISLNNSRSFKITSSNIYRTNYDNGLYTQSCENFSLSNVNIVNSSWNGLALYLSSNYILQNSSVNGSAMQGTWLGYGKNATVTNCALAENMHNAVYSVNLTDAHLTSNRLTSNTQAASIYQSNATFSDNYVAANGLDYGAYYGGFQSADSNCTVTGNTFSRNYDAVIWETHENSYSNIFTVTNNIFQSNLYTFFFDYTLQADATNQKLVFTNNLVNDTAYVDPVGFAEFTNSSFADKVINLNSTMQAGARIYGNGPNIGGNYWAYPNGTGPSQTGADADGNGFIDAKFSLFNNASIGNAMDYLPLSTGYTVPPTPSPSPTASPAATPAPTAAPTSSPTVTAVPTSTPHSTSAPSATPGETSAVDELPWFYPVALVLIMAIGALAMAVSKRRQSTVN